MATIKQAERARAKHANRLRKLGAHSVEVRSVGTRSAVIVANVPPGFRGKMPDKVNYTVDDATVSVPVAVERKEAFEAE